MCVCTLPGGDEGKGREELAELAVLLSAAASQHPSPLGHLSRPSSWPLSEDLAGDEGCVRLILPPQKLPVLWLE